MVFPATKSIVNGHVVITIAEGPGHALPSFQLANLLKDKFGCISTLMWLVRDESSVEALAKEHGREGSVEIVVVAHQYDDFLVGGDPELWRKVIIPRIYEKIEVTKRPLTAVIGGFTSTQIHLLKEEFRVPTWRFFVSPLAFVSFLYEFRWSAKLIGEGVDCPDIGRVEQSDFPRQDSKIDFDDFSGRVIADSSECDGMLVNDCKDLYSDEYFNFTTRKVPVKGPTLVIGPIAAYDTRLSRVDPSDDCIAWLNSKPPRSVVYCALGSGWSLPPADACTFARCNAECGMNVLWAHRKPHPRMVEMAARQFGPKPVPEDYDATTGLPKNFAADNIHFATWVNQPAVLTHPAIACFVTHCGWNSTVEAMTYGVPLVCVPITSDQPVTAKMIERHLGNGKAVWYGPNSGTLERQNYLDTLKEVCGEPKYLDNARKIQQIVHHSVKDDTGSSVKDLNRFVEFLTRSTSKLQ